MPDLHSRIASELSRRLEVAKAATPGPWEMGGEGRREPKHPNGELFSVGVEDDERCRWVADTWDGPDAALIALHDPADAERRYSSALRVLERHAIVHRNIGWLEPDDGELVECYAEIPVCGTCVPKHSHFKTRAGVPDGACIEVRDVAASLGLDTEGSTTDG